MTTDNTIDFSMLLASSVHDIKNSLGMLLSTLEEVIEETSSDQPKQQRTFGTLHGEASRINNSLIYLLGLYRIQQDQLRLSLEEIYVADFLEEQVISQQLLFDVNNIEIEIHCDDNLSAYFDENLIAGVISNVLVNGAKYTKDKITLRAEKVDDHLVVNIVDNGSGYPEAILSSANNHDRSIDFTSGSTNLGLYFAQRIAEMHECKGKHGSIALSNLETGGCFTLTLP